MTDTPPGTHSSWVDLTREFGGQQVCSHASPPVPSSPSRTTPVPVLDPEYIRMLKEAQKDSARNSARVSPISSALMSLSSTCKNTPCGGSPKSPPNSPNVGLADYRDLKEQLKTQGVFINREPEPSMDDILTSTDWRSRPNSLPPKAWRLAESSAASSGGSSVSAKTDCLARDWSQDLVLTVIGTNVLSLALGIGFGYWVYRKSAS